MAWYPRAERLELQPESRDQPTIVPTQFIVHSIAAPWDEERIYEYWRDSTNLESHFGLDFDGSLGQFLSTTTKADANFQANARAVSIETASNTKHTDPWTDAQVEQLIRLGLWLHQQHGIPLRICRSWDDPGFGYHSLFREWSTSGTACPGEARIRQFHDVVFPGIVARATNPTAPSEEDELATTLSQERSDSWNGMIWGLKHTTEATLALVQAQGATIEKLVAAVAAQHGLDPDALVAEIRSAIADAVVRVKVEVGTDPATTAS